MTPIVAVMYQQSSQTTDQSDQYRSTIPGSLGVITNETFLYDDRDISTYIRGEKDRLDLSFSIPEVHYSEH